MSARRAARIGVVQARIDPLPDHCVPGSGSQYLQSLRTDFLEPRIKRFERLIERAGKDRCDLVLATEDMTGACTSFRFQPDHPEMMEALIDTIPGEITRRMGLLARTYNMYIVAPIVSFDGSVYRNSAALIDRGGNVCGVYHKVHIPQSEAPCLVGGDEFPVFAMDFANLGIAICYDIVFPETCQILAMKGADLIVVPSMALGVTEDSGLARLKCRASDNSVHLASALYRTHSKTGRSCIIDWDGVILADASYLEDAVITADIDFARERLGGEPPYRPRRLLERRVDLYHEALEEAPILAERYPDAKLPTPRSQAGHLAPSQKAR